jgi:hypothetical protein
MLRRLSLAYGRCPHADEAINVLAPVLSAGRRWLLDLNLDLLTGLAAALGSPARLVLTSQLPMDRDADRTGRIVAICRAVGAGDLWAGTGTRGYLDPEDLRPAGITVAWNEYAARHPQYRQAWPRQGFTPALSVIDAVSSIGWAGTAVMLRAGLRAFQTAPEPEGIQP